ncbi:MULTISPECIES: VOC family protein [unclassified Sphingomonas]|uniref:VOC family protein n=1 Tax=unclassified Sphingomonas TaxID=196159 RepID=UPI0006FAADBB|nr:MULTISPECIES: VOC family protein [unclassified Sphingomonas]KQX23512.1 biphenyl 2,3-dioxygenase [Sphingomonas sp. Root1294]KQY68362.1 biphenyl 2,3-dioxygenase [Sphingomonas sp. Root50]KRB91265.1 biphenyl 2,3-dioxygenase [Sphingomonas sp. Root720]
MAISELGYIVLRSAKIDQWRHFAEQVVGMQAIDGPDGALYLKMDRRNHRFLILPGAEERYVASGWLLRDKADFDGFRTRLEAAGVPLTNGSREDSALRKVQDFFSFSDPAGNRHEAGWGPISNFQPFVSPIGTGRFVTGELGLGHTVLPALNIEETLEFWTTVMGFEASDSLLQPITEDLTVQLYFLHCRNRRQHSLALAQMPSDVGCVHLMVEFADFDDVGRALDRQQANNVPLAMTLGKHVNDDMISFYMMTPGKFIIELGWGAPPKEWENEIFFETTLGSHWGHKWVLQDPDFQLD